MADEKPKVEDNPIYQAILAKLEERDKEVEALKKSITEVTDFNKALLSRKGPDISGSTDEDAAKEKLEKYLNEN